jgi:hypothetical protein
LTKRWEKYINIARIKNISNLRIKFYSNWIEDILEQALNPDTMRNFGFIWDGQFWFRLVRVGDGDEWVIAQG